MMKLTTIGYDFDGPIKVRNKSEGKNVSEKAELPENDDIYYNDVYERDRVWKNTDLARAAGQEVGDKFDAMYGAQLESQLYLSKYVDHACYPDNDLIGKQQLFKDVLLLLIKECTEVLDEINFKHHTKKKIVDREALKEELIDVLKYWMNLCLLYDIKSEEILDAFLKKTNKVIKKFDNEMGIKHVYENETDSKS